VFYDKFKYDSFDDLYSKLTNRIYMSNDEWNTILRNVVGGEKKICEVILS